MTRPKAPEPAVTPDFLRELQRLQADHDKAMCDYGNAKSKAKILKEIMDEKKEAIFDFIRQADAKLPLLDGQEGSA